MIQMLANIGWYLISKVVLDLCCLALNQLPPLYIRSEVDLYSYITDVRRIEMENKVADALTKAYEWLKNDQRQGRKDED